MFRIYNTLTRRLEEFRPLKKKRVGFYTCGPTVYRPATIGNMRTYLFEDVLERTLRLLGYRVKRVMNITDVGHLVGDGDEGEDKIEREAARAGKSAWDIAKMYEERFLNDLRRLNIEVPDAKHLPHATDYILEQIALVKKLEKKGFTYRTPDGVYFDTAKWPDYGKLSGQPLEEKVEGARVEANPEKRHATDFALWKFSPPGVKRQMEWPSPWGTGFPGWHIECSAMSAKLLGQPFDIHASGVDHIPVHHENEIAQSEAAYGKPLANYWMHGEFLLIDGGRMGKSLGNAYTLDDVVAKGFDPLAFRYFCLGAHYRSKLNFTWDALDGAQNALRKLFSLARSLPPPSQTIHQREAIREIRNFQGALEDDLNAAQALAIMWDVAKYDIPADQKSAALLKMDEVLGLRIADVLGQPLDIPAEIVALAEERQIAREKKDWKRADALRDQIVEKGWNVEDAKDGFELVPNS